MSTRPETRWEILGQRLPLGEDDGTFRVIARLGAGSSEAEAFAIARAYVRHSGWPVVGVRVTAPDRTFRPRLVLTATTCSYCCANPAEPHRRWPACPACNPFWPTPDADSIEVELVEGALRGRE